MRHLNESLWYAKICKIAYIDVSYSRAAVIKSAAVNTVDTVLLMVSKARLPWVRLLGYLIRFARPYNQLISQSESMNKLTACKEQQQAS